MHINKLIKLKCRRIKAVEPGLEGYFILILINTQKLYLIKNSRIIRKYAVSTSKCGKGNLQGSKKTPIGLHRIYKKIGKQQVKYAVFKDRLPTGEVWDGKSEFGDLILSRILVLDGLEKGLNRGKNVDTRSRYIYIHGTNHEKSIGRPVSHGCITMKNDDIMDLFENIKKGDLVEII
jgi:hypothetical protein